MHELLIQISRQLRGMWRYRWYAMLAAWLVCVTGWLVVYTLPDQYQASARIYIDTTSKLTPLLRGIAVNSGDTRQRVELMTRTLLSRPNLEKLARMTDLDLRSKDPESMETVLNELAGHISIAGTDRENLYTLAYEDKDRELAKKVVQSLLTIFVESSLGQGRADTDAATQFLSSQIKDYETKLTQAEERLAEFKRRNVGMMPGSGQDYYASLQTAATEFKQAQLMLEEARRRADQIRAQMESDEESYSLYSQMQTQQSSPMAARIQQLQTNVENMLLKYTDKHPDVIETRRLIGELEAQQKKEDEEMVESGAAQEASPVYQQTKLALTEAEANIASLEARVKEHEARVQKLKEMVDTVPRIEAELTQLNRDYDVNRRNYEALLARRESAKISEQAEISTDDIKFRVIDPPRVPLEPSGPNRVLFSSLVLLAALGLGIALAFLLSQMRPAFHDSRNLREITGLPVLGGVSMLHTPEYLAQRRVLVISYSLAGVALLLLYGGVLTLQAFDLKLLPDQVAQWMGSVT
jgi:polysaccharide chain length determinant protein (PEP-CTERM system associated)